MKKLWNDLDKPLFFVTLIFFIFGSLNIITSSSSEALNNGQTIYYYFIREVAIVSLGYLLGLIIIKFPKKSYKYIFYIAYIVLLLVLAYLAFSGTAHRGANNWFHFLGLAVQPSEFMKPVMIVVLSLLLERFKPVLSDEKSKHDKLIAIICLVALLPAILIYEAQDAGSMLIIMAIFGIIFLCSYIPCKDKWRTIIFFISAVGVLLLVLHFANISFLTDSQTNRFDYFNPCSKYENGGYQVCNGFIAINNGGLFGLGIGKSKQKYSYIPEAHTDSVFAIIAEEYGLIWSSVILLVYLYIVYRVLKISREATTAHGKYITIGVATYIMAHIIINLGGLLGLIPLTGVPLPFLSYGGSFGLSLACSLALVERVAIETRRSKIKVK